MRLLNQIQQNIGVNILYIYTYICIYTHIHIYIYMHVSAQGSIIFYAPEKNLVILLIAVGLVKGLYSTQ